MRVLPVALLGLTYYVYGRVPSAFIPEEDAGYFITMAMQPDERGRHERELLRHYLDVSHRLKKQLKTTGRNDPILAGKEMRSVAAIAAAVVMTVTVRGLVGTTTV